MSSFLKELKAYTNTDGFVGNTPCAGSGRTGDNMLMFSAEAFLVLKDNWMYNHPTAARSTAVSMINLIPKVTFPSGWFSRYTVDTDIGWDLTPDNLLGYLTLCTKEQANALVEHLHMYDGMVTITFDKEGFTPYRQPQLYFAMLAVAGRLSRFNPIHIALAIWTALVIIEAGWNKPSTEDQDARRLSYLLIRLVETRSFLCKLASKIWWQRLKKDYGYEGLRLVYTRYFLNPNHPIARWALNVWDLPNNN